MKKNIFTIIALLSLFQSKAYATDEGILNGVDKDKLRSGDIHLEDFPAILKGAIDYLMGFAGTIAVIFIILGAYKIALGSLENDKNKGKEMITLAISGFVLASLSWVIIKIIIDNFMS